MTRARVCVSAVWTLRGPRGAVGGTDSLVLPAATPGVSQRREKMMGAQRADFPGSLEAPRTATRGAVNMKTLKFSRHIATVLKVDDGGARVPEATRWRYAHQSTSW